MGARREAGEPLDLPAGVEHGTETGYKRRCRCRPCLDAANNNRNRRRDRQSGATPGELAVAGIPAWHGTDNGYVNRGCRCRFCTLAHTHENYKRKRRTWVDPKTLEAALDAAQHQAYRRPAGERAAALAAITSLHRLIPEANDN